MPVGQERMELKLRSDTRRRKWHFSPKHFAHPAKMHLGLQEWIIEHYSKPSDVILDPMAGSGTLLIACSMGRNVILVELESKFITMIEENWQRIQQIGPQMGCKMGWAVIKQGDARDLQGVLVDCAIFSPPHGNRLSDVAVMDGDKQRMSYRQALADCVISSPPYSERMDGGMKDAPSMLYTDEPKDAWFTQRDQKNIGNLRYGDIDCVISSPPYEGALGGSSRHTKGGIPERDKRLGQTGTYAQVDVVMSSPPYEGTEARDRSKEKSWREDLGQYPKRGDVNISKGYQVDVVMSSPPYEGSISTADAEEGKYRAARLRKLGREDIASRIENPKDRWGHSIDTKYSEDKENIGNLKSANYLEAMLQVYRQCWGCLKPEGLMVLVTKNFIRDKAIVPLDEHTIKLCQEAGFEFVERHYRKLLSQSFWRTIYYQKYPDASRIEREDILVFRKGQCL